MAKFFRDVAGNYGIQPVYAIDYLSPSKDVMRMVFAPEQIAAVTIVQERVAKPQPSRIIAP